MDKKEQLQSLIASLSPEQIEEFEALLQKSSVTSRNTKKKRRRGKGRRKKREAAEAKEQQLAREKQPKDSPSADDFLKGLRLTAAEKEELQEASRSDKEMGAHEASQSPRPTKKKADHRVEVRCRICGKTEKVSGGIVPPEKDRFKCNTCCCSAG
jgi:phage protein D